VRTPSSEGLAELAASIKANGILQPLLVRPKAGKYELVCGHRRLAAARQAGLDQVPVFARDMDDVSALAAQIIENVQREDTHALDEADAYRRLLTTAKLDVATIAARVGRSVPYVYDRMRLAALVPEVKQLFRADRITPGHAVVLARLEPKQQKLAIDDTKGGLFESEDLLFAPGDGYRPNRDGISALKLRTVRELQGWIDEHVKFDPAAQDLPQLFPDTHAALAAAKEQAEKIVPITHDYHVHPDARDGQRTFGPMSWKQADGQAKSKTCDRSVTGVFVIGPCRGEALKVCVDKACDVHWGKAKREAKARSRALKADQKRQAEAKRREADRDRFNKAVPEIMKAIAAAIAKAPAKAGGKLGDILVHALSGHYGAKKFAALLKRGKSAEDLIRYCALLIVGETAANDWRAAEDLPRIAKSLGVDCAKFVSKIAPPPGREKGTPEPEAGDGEAEGDEE
jgi:ParB/RepB/Spo0J family partition protein